jgi:polyphosphate kinase
VDETVDMALNSTDAEADPLLDPALYINRELSWIEFNRRVLEEAQDPTVPLLERLRFISIFASNFDEFFMVRVANLKEKIAQGITTTSGGDQMLPREQMDRISHLAHDLYLRAVACLQEEILPPLGDAGIRILTAAELSEQDSQYLDELFAREIFLVLTPLAVDPSHPFPHLAPKSLNLAIRLRRPHEKQVRLAFVQVPSVLARYVVLRKHESGCRLFPLEEAIRRNLRAIFPGMKILDASVFRVTRDSDLDLDDYEEIKDLAETIERQVRERRLGAATRLEVEFGAPPELIEELRDALDLEPEDVYELPGPIDMTGLSQICSLPGYRDLRYPEFVPRVDPAIQGASKLWTSIRQGDILLHHPYDSFKPVLDFVSGAADDPDVLAIKQTLYRTSQDSPIIRALQRAAENGKQVTAIVELQARLDEERNIAWARALERSGVHVVFGFVGVKTHCKVALVVRRDEDGIRRYVHLSTGNYNPETARIYTDVGLLTCDRDFADDVSVLFNYLTGFSELPDWKKIKVAPTGLRNFLIEKIRAEADLGARGRIVAKVNAVLEPSIVRELYAASRAGVRIELVCRGICALRPKLKGYSETVRVASIVDRFLEHSRIFYFGGGGEPEVYVGSADWMDRNLRRRIEVVFPIEDERLRARLFLVLAVSLRDDVKARDLHPDGTWRRPPRASKGAPMRSQSYFLEHGDQPNLPPRRKRPLLLEDVEAWLEQSELEGACDPGPAPRLEAAAG